MQIIWDPEKNKKLNAERGIALAELAIIILERRYLAVLKNPARPGQRIFVLSYHGYTQAVPFVFDSERNIVLKTAFPSRKCHKIYGGKK
ncbi:MAG: toxin [Candidatus Margulisbacteria bacterium]|nr:toxin [Candidatus Margulisiibacteriota bacterium]